MTSRTLRTLFGGLFAVGLAVVPLACGGGDSGANDTGGYQFVDRVDPGLPDSADPGTPDASKPDAGRDTPGPQDPRLEIFFLHDTSVPVQIPNGGGIKVRLKVIDYTSASPAVGALIEFSLTSADGHGDAVLSAQRVQTGTEGLAEVRVEGGDIPAEYTLTARTAYANDASARIDVLPLPTGDLRVNLIYEGQLGLTDIDLRLMPRDRFQCSRFYAPAPPGGYTDQRFLYSPSDPPPVFEDLIANDHYVVYVLAKWNGRLAAAGCAETRIDANVLTTVDVEIADLFVNPAGQYDMVAVFDFRGAIPGEVGRIVDLIANLFYDPGQFVVDMVILVIDYYLGQLVGGIVEWALGLFEDQITDAITNWVLHQSPDWIQEFWRIGQDVVQIIAQLELLADLRIDKVDERYLSVQGTEDWTGLAFYWRLGCPLESSPDYDPMCGRNVFSMHALRDLSPEFPLDLIQGKWDGTITNYNQLIVHRHAIELNYGRLILFVINEVLLPVITGPACSVDLDCGRYSYCRVGRCEYHSLLDAMHGFVNCRGLGDWVESGVLSGLGINGDDVTAFCTNAIDFVISPIVAIVYNLGLDSRLRLHGSAVMWDEDNDLRVDFIEDGEFFGHIEIEAGTSGSEFRAVWHAERR